MVGVARGDMIVVAMTLRHDAEKHHAARHPLHHIGEIFGTHERRRHWDIVVRAEEVGRDAAREIDKPRVYTRGSSIVAVTRPSKPISGQRSIVSVKRAVPSRRACGAGIGSAKKIQTCPPLPDRERSRTAGIPLSRQVAMNARASRAHDDLSKSAARNQQLSSGSIG
jgi:hypothetical protein